MAMEKRALACVTCARAKSRCVKGPDDANKCERCHRLNKTCLSRSPAPPRAKKRAKRSRVAELEKRLSELSSRVNGRQQQREDIDGEDGPQHEDAAGAGSDESVGSPGSSGETGSDGVAGSDPSSRGGTGGGGEAGGARRGSAGQGTGSPDTANGLYFGHLFPPAAHKSSSAWPSVESLKAAAAASASVSATGTVNGAAVAGPSLIRPGLPWPTDAESETLVQMYREKLEGLFPFVPVPAGASATELRTQRPYLWKGIVLACCFVDGARQQILGDEVASEIGRISFVEGRKSLDLLQGLQLLVAWFHHALSGSRLTSLLFLARSMCLNLGLGGTAAYGEGVTPTNLDGQRAYAGTYYLNTLVLTTNKRTEVLMNTTYLEHCCRLLENAKQQPADEYLVKLVRIQQLAQAISITLDLDPRQRTSQLPLTMVVQTFQEQLNSFAASLSPELSSQDMLQSHIHIAELLLTEIGLSDSLCASADMPLTDRLELLWSCLRSLRLFFSGRNMSEADLVSPRFLCLHGSDLTYALLIGVKLVTLRLPGWDLELVDRELDFWATMDQLVEHLGSVVAVRRSGWLTAQVAHKYHDPFARLVTLTSGLRHHVREAMQQARADARSPSGTMGALTAALRMGDEMDAGFWPEFMNDGFWDTFTGDLTVSDMMIQ